VEWGFVGCFAVDFSPSVRDQKDFFLSPFLILVFYNRNRKSTSREITTTKSSAEGGLAHHHQMMSEPIAKKWRRPHFPV
jgi:hypothetical protein